MRGGVVAAGVILMILGAILFFVYPITPNNSGANPFGDLFIGPVLGFIGFIVLIAGLAASPNTPPTVIYQTAPAPSYPSPSGQAWNSIPQPSSQPAPQPVAPPPTTQTAAAPTDTTSPPIAAESEGGFCPHCGKPTKSGYKFCRSCGGILD